MTDPQAHSDPDSSGDLDASSTEPALPSGVLDQPAGHFEPEWPAETPGSSDAATTTLIACTVAGRGQLPAARVLRDSFLHHHPGARFLLLLADWPDPEQTDVRTPLDIGVEAAEFARLAMACTAEQLRTTLCPRLLTHLLTSGSTVLYLEPSVQVFGTFDDLLADLTSQRPVALVPRVLRPLFADGLRPSAADLAEAGTYDPGVFAVRPGAEDFLSTWTEHLRGVPESAGTFLDGAPALVEHQVLRGSGVGLSVWNAAQRDVRVSDEGVHTVDGLALRSVHFDGFQPQRPWLLSVTYADRPRVLLSEHPVLARLCAAYRNALVAAGYTREEPHPFDTLPDGSIVPNALRTEYLNRWLQGEQLPTSPFDLASDDHDPVAAFLEWACAPTGDKQRVAGASRWTAAVWADDPALREDYPDPFGSDAESFHEWCAGVGVASARVPRAAVHRRDDPASTLVDQLGVAVLGTGHLAELVRAAVRSSGLPSADTPYYPVVLRCDPDVAVPAGRHLIDVRPDAEGPLSAETRETWVLSETSRTAVPSSGGPTVRTITLPVLDQGPVNLPTRKGARARHGLSDEFVIGALIDHADERHGNVLGLVSAFFAAFADRADVRLLIGVSGAGQHPETAERLRLATATDPRVILLEDELDTDGLLGAADCVASLHRAEDGAGGDRIAMWLLEVAGQGVPVIASGHGAVSELLGDSGAKLVSCRGAGEPDIDAAAAVLRSAAVDPDGTANFGITARDHLLTKHDVASAGQHVRERVEHAYRNWRTRWAKDKHGQVDDPLHPLLVARHALHRAPDVGDGSRNAMAPALRKAVLKALSHYDDHIRDVMRSLVDGVEQTAAELLRRQYDADDQEWDAGSLRAELTQLGQRQDELSARITGTDDGAVRADLAEQQRRLAGLEQAVGVRTERRTERTDALAERLDSLTGAVERTLDRIDALERDRSSTGEQDIEAGVRTASHDANYALQRTDVLQRILLREHERHTGSGDDTSTPVVCDAGLLQMPSDDSLMLPWLSSHASWEAETSALIDSLLEPDGVFLDVGAYVGYQSVRVLNRFGNSGAVVAVEPCERSRELLGRNVEVNVPPGRAHLLTVVGLAAWDSACELTAERSPGGGMSVRPAEARVGTEESAAESIPDEQGVWVSAVRLDRELEYLPPLEQLRLSVVHVDVGDSVHRVLGGLVRLLRRDRPSIVCSFTPSAITQSGDDPAAALREFSTWGYDLIPVGRSQAVTADELLEAVEAATSSHTVKLWLRPKDSAQ